jgi:putative ABC transport system permease protein
MFARLVRESFVRNPRRKMLTAAALVLGMAVATATLTVALEVGDRMAREFRSLGANLLVTPRSDTLPLEIGGVDYRPVDEGAYLNEAAMGKLKTIFWRHNILGFTPFLDVPVSFTSAGDSGSDSRAEKTPVSSTPISSTMIGTWYEHAVPVPDGTTFTTGASFTHPWWKVQGRWFGDNANECVIGAALATKYPVGLAIGKTINVQLANAVGSSPQTVSLVVTGILSTGGTEDNAVLAPLSVAQQLSGHPGQFRQLFVSALTKPADALAARDPKSLTATEYDRWFCSPYISSISYQIEQVLPDTDVRAIRQVADTEGRILSRVSLLLWIVTLAALIAAALAVAATSAATVLDRRAEIGIMKAIGATNALVAALFLAEQAMLAIVGGTVGFLLGAGLARVLGASVFGSPATPRIILLPVALGLAALVAIIGSLIPLRRAAHFNPAPILRDE